jgi:GntR family transcriptional regulator
MDNKPDLTRPEGLYLQVARLLRDSINITPAEDEVPTTEEYWPGDALPSEHVLAQRFRVSRQTVRAAIAVLVGDGLLEVIHGRGTFVRTPPVRLPLSRYSRRARQPGLGPWESACARQGIDGYTEMALVDHRPADVEVATGLDVPVGTDVVYRRRYMHAGTPDAILQIQEGYLPLNLVAGSDLAGPEKVADGIYAALDRIGHAPVRETEVVVTRAPTYEETLVFGRPGVQVIQMTRLTYDGAGLIVEWLKVVAAGDRTELVYEDLPIG